MSDPVFPVLPGLAWSVFRTPQWSSNVDASKSGRQYAVGDRIYPTYKWKLPYEFLRARGSFTEWQTLFGFVNSLRGRVNPFLYRDPNDFVVSAQSFGAGDGVTTTFPLVRTLGGFAEPTPNCDSVTGVSVNGTAAGYGTGAGQWRVDALAPATTSIIFASAPASGAALAWSGTYYWRCRLTQGDAIDFEQFLSGYWKADIEFESFRP